MPNIEPDERIAVFFITLTCFIQPIILILVSTYLHPFWFALYAFTGLPLLVYLFFKYVILNTFASWKIYKDISVKNDKKCNICFIKFRKDSTTMFLPCKHYYHYHCMYSWIRTSGNYSCPYCSRPFNSFDYNLSFQP